MSIVVLERIPESIQHLFTIINYIPFLRITNVNIKMFTFVKQNYTYEFRTIIQSI